MHSRPYDAPRLAACEESKARTVLRDRHWRFKRDGPNKCVWFVLDPLLFSGLEFRVLFSWQNLSGGHRS